MTSNSSKIASQSWADIALVKIASMSTLAIALWVSVAVHAVILAIKFEPELKKLANRLPPLEVVLVNAKTKAAPDKADLIAQANLDRGGNTDANRHMKTALPAPTEKTTEVKLKPTPELKSAARASMIQAKEAREQKRLAELEKQAQELMTQLKSQKEVASNPTQVATAADPEKGEQKSVGKTLSRDDLVAASIEMDRLEAQIAKQQEEYQKRPKRRFIGSRTKAASDAMYLEAWRQKVERIGNMNYPAAARDQKIYGSLQMTVSIKSDGTVENIEINKSSGSKILDEAAINIVKLAAPYAVFPEEMKKTTDILGITRTWTFTQEDMLATQGN
jgi:periplasmic protein TonB